MKTERRHELQKNDLADVLGHEIEFIRPYFKTILAVLIAIVAVVFTIAFLSNQRATKNAAAWGQFFDAIAEGDPELIEKFADNHASTRAGMWARLQAANQKLADGSRLMFEDRKEAEVSLDQARKDFQTLIDQSSAERDIKRRARFGLAQTYVAMNDPESALPILEEIVKEDEADPVGKAAAEHLAQVKRLSEAQWFAWFDKHKPTPLPDFSSGRSPLGLDNLPAHDDLRKKKADDLPLSGLLEDELNDNSGGTLLGPLTPPGVQPPADPPGTDSETTPPADSDPAPSEDAPADPPADDAAPEEPKSDEPAATDAPADDAPSSEAPADEAPADDTNNPAEE